MARWLEGRGYELVARNWETSLGEVDIIALHPRERWLVFVEVRTLYGRGVVEPEWTVTRPKQRRLVRLARLFLTRNPRRYEEHVVVFDVCGVHLREGRVTHIPCAFSAE